MTTDMTHLPSMPALIDVAEDATVSRTILKADDVTLVLFAFDTGQELSEHTAAMPVLLQVLDGSLEVAAGGTTVALTPGGAIHLATRVPHSVVALEPTRMLLTMVSAART